jgi:hypothetical protein
MNIIKGVKEAVDIGFLPQHSQHPATSKVRNTYTELFRRWKRSRSRLNDGSSSVAGMWETLLLYLVMEKINDSAASVEG